MIKKASLMAALSVTAFSGWAQDSNSDTLVVTANRFQQCGQYRAGADRHCDAR